MQISEKQLNKEKNDFKTLIVDTFNKVLNKDRLLVCIILALYNARLKVLSQWLGEAMAWRFRIFSEFCALKGHWEWTLQV